MSDQNQLTDHNYDGILEYDNPLPGWWMMLFWLSIFFAVPYWAYYHFGVPGRSTTDRYAAEMADNLRLQFDEIGDLSPDRKTLLKFMNDEKWLEVGKSVYATHCVACHGTHAEGKVGPNLTDPYWKNVKKVEDIATVVLDGARGQAMPAWKQRLHINEAVLVSAYIAQLQGKLPPGVEPKPRIEKEDILIESWE